MVWPQKGRKLNYGTLSFLKGISIFAEGSGTETPPSQGQQWL